MRDAQRKGRKISGQFLKAIYVPEPQEQGAKRTRTQQERPRMPSRSTARDLLSIQAAALPVSNERLRDREYVVSILESKFLRVQ